jgi:hypothetical protein
MDNVKLPQGWELALVLWGVIAPLVGIIVGHFLTRSWQREQWFMDRRWQEYQELLSAVSAAYMAIIRLDIADKALSRTAALVHEVEAIKIESFRVLRDRIFIAEELTFADILVKWDTAVTNYEMNKEERRFAERFTELNEHLTRMALSPPKRLGWFKRWRMH